MKFFAPVHLFYKQLSMDQEWLTADGYASREFNMGWRHLPENNSKNFSTP